MANRSRNLPPMLPPPTLIPPVLVPPLPPIERSPRCRWRQLLALLAASSLAHPIPRFGTQLALWNASLAWGRKDASDSADCSLSSSIVPYGYRYMYGWAMPTGGFNGRPSRRNATMIKKITCGGRLCLPAAPVRARLPAPAGDALTLWPRSAAQRALLVARAASYYRSAANAPNAAAATHHHGKSIGRLAADWTTLLSWLAIGGFGGGLADVGDSSNATTLSVATAATAGSNGMASADAVARQIVPYRRHRAEPNATSRREPLLASHPSRAPSCEHFLAALPPPPARPCLPPPPQVPPPLRVPQAGARGGAGGGAPCGSKRRRRHRPRPRPCGAQRVRTRGSRTRSPRSEARGVGAQDPDGAAPHVAPP